MTKIPPSDGNWN